MSERRRLLKRVQDVRERLRDAAAGSVAEQEVVVRAAATRFEDAAATLESLVSAPAERLREVHNASALELLDAERRSARFDVLEQDQALRSANLEDRRRRALLNSRERDLRVAETLLDRERALRDAAGRKEEQRMADDLSGTRSARR